MTITGQEGTYPTTINRRITEILALNAAFTVQGDILTEVAFTPSTTIDSNGIFRRLTTQAVVNDVAYIGGTPLYNRQKEPSFHCRFRLTSSSNLRMFIGLTSASITGSLASSVAAGNYGGLYIDTSTSSNFQTIRGSGSTPSLSSLGVAVDTGYHDIYMWMKKSGGHDNLVIQLDNNTRVEYTSTIPTTSAIMRYVAGIGNVSNIAKSIEIAKLSVNTET